LPIDEAGMPIIIGMFPHAITIGIPMAIMRVIISQRSRIMSIEALSIGMHLQTMPSLVISQVIRHIIGAIMGIIIGIIMGMLIPMPIDGIMFMPMLPAIGIIGAIMGIIGFGWPVMGIAIPLGIGMFIGIAGIMVHTSLEDVGRDV
jgi:hypothetical protein